MPRFAEEYAARLAGPWTDIQDQLEMLHKRARSYPGVRVAEFGVRTGESTAAFLAAAEAADGHVWSFDVDPPQVPGRWLRSPLWTFTRCSSLAAEPPAVDVLFIDTSHEYEATLAELRHLVPAVLPGGLVLMHDTKLDRPGFDPCAVARALDTWSAETGIAWHELGGHYGLGEIFISKKGMAAQWQHRSRAIRPAGRSPRSPRTQRTAAPRAPRSA